MFAAWKRREREIEEYIAKESADALKDAQTAQEKWDAGQMVHSMTQDEHFEAEHLRQHSLLKKLRRSPLEVSEDFMWEEPNWRGGSDLNYDHHNLTRKGEKWARHELAKLRKAEIEFWFKLVMPVVALVMSIIALVKKSH
jgi:hypothetical protein